MNDSTSLPSPLSISTHFAQLPDPRINRRKRHMLIDIITIALCAVICGADSWTQVEQFGLAKLQWFRSFLKLPAGIPSHDTFGRFFARLDPKLFQAAFLQWVQSLNAVLPQEVIAIDGKCLRRSHDRSHGNPAIHMVSAWACSAGLVLGQLKTDQKSNEITAIPQLLSVLELSGCLITIDAMGCQKKIAAQIRHQGADYLFSLKGNQSSLKETVSDHFKVLQESPEQTPHDSFETIDGEHGRIETRKYWTLCDFQEDLIDPSWTDLKMIGMVESKREVAGKTTLDRRFYITSREMTAEAFAHAVRSHWHIENKLHWCLDIGFREDESRVRAGFAAENFAIIRHIALNLLKNDKKLKGGIATKRRTCGWNLEYLEGVLRRGLF